MIKLSCQQCSKAFGAPDDAAGKNIRCPHCQAVNKIPAAQSADASDAPASAAPAAVNISVSTSESAVRRPYSRRKRSPLPLILAGVAVVIVGGVVVFALTRGGSDEPDENIADNKPSENKPAQPDDTKPVAKPNLPPTLDPIRSATVKAGDTLAFQARGTDPDGAGALIYSLADDAPDGAAIHPGTGQFTWTPGKEQYGQSFQFSVRVQEPGDAGLSASQPLVVQVASPERPIDRLLAALRARGANAELLAEASSAPFSGDCQIVSVDDDQVAAYQYDSRESVAADAAQVAPDMKTMFGQPRVWTEPVRLYQTDALLVMYTGDNASTIARLDAQLGTPFAMATATTTIAESGPDLTPAPPPKPAVVQVLLDLHEQKNLFKPSEYPTIRRAFAEQFQADQEPKIKAAYGDQYDAMTAWLDEHAELKEEFYNAIDPTNDDVAAVLGLFAGLKDQFPDKIAPYGNLAIATAVTWDNPRGVYDYSRHAQRTRSTMPDELADAVANFQYFLEAEQFMQGRGQFLPWEFLLHMINHKTPRDEREWSLANYLTRRVMFGKIYSDVPYDDEMLRTQSQVCRLADKAYILPNILQFGGVCAMQADFAARVGKSIGVPAEYVRGESIYGDLHAWVLWVELTSVTKGSIGFRIESHGRYRGDKYYVGTLTDPQTGQQMTDRQLELRLHTVGVNTAAKRHADLFPGGG